MSLSHIQSLRLTAVLEDCSDQLDILGHTLTVQISRERDTAAAQERARLTKLRRDCQYICQQVLKLHLDLKEKQSFSSVLQVVEEEEQKKKAENVQREEKRELEQRKQTLQRQKEDHQQKTEKLKDLCQLAKDLKHQLNEQSLQIANRKKIVEKDTELQLQLTQKETSQAEKLLEDQLELLQKQLKVEVRVHEESEKFLQNQHEELQQQLQQWQECTKMMLQEKEQQLNSVRCRRTVNLDKLSEMRRKFREMEQVVMEDREEQEKLRQQQAEARAATKLQAWWRGCMVRRGLGSFQRAEKDKKGKKKKDGKKKKKK
ncbi:dynein regulatory complex protein 9 [Xiphias gladius]|uniref:dynein regulatory complex protein 9 n=1 Tax=Xiphias gladius TaxID=8245 RepID=UPI001A9A16BB|nr:dynein regulatory complex protein 9 [Xiphias gladius]XP_039974110.1 dynein regulatory complex protein 9 [Xiphias gladius]